MKFIHVTSEIDYKNLWIFNKLYFLFYMLCRDETQLQAVLDKYFTLNDQYKNSP
jgi:hypothetical protein